MYLTAVPVNMVNFKSRHRGKVVALTGASWFCGPGVFSAVYSSSFGKRNDINGFFVTLCIIMFVVNLLAAIFVKDYSHLVMEEKGYEEFSSESKDTVVSALIRNHL